MTDVTMTHPAHRAAHAVNNALQILNGFSERHALQALQMDASDVRRLLEDVPADIAALYQCNERLEEDLRGLRDQGLEDAREITRLREELAAARRALDEAQNTAEELVRELAPLAGMASDLFRRANGIRLSNATPRRLSVITHEPPRIAAVEA